MPTEIDYDEATRTIVGRAHGVLTRDEVDAWRDALHGAAGALSAGSRFRALVDLRGYEVAAQDPATHQVLRSVAPRFLAAHGYAVGFWRLYGQTPPAPSSPVRCAAVAHVHHDAHAIARYDELLGGPTERFFTDPTEAAAWLATT